MQDTLDKIVRVQQHLCNKSIHYAAKCRQIGYTDSQQSVMVTRLDNMIVALGGNTSSVSDDGSDNSSLSDI